MQHLTLFSTQPHDVFAKHSSGTLRWCGCCCSTGVALVGTGMCFTKQGVLTALCPASLPLWWVCWLSVCQGEAPQQKGDADTFTNSFIIITTITTTTITTIIAILFGNLIFPYMVQQLKSCPLFVAVETHFSGHLSFVSLHTPPTKCLFLIHTHWTDSTLDFSCHYM